MQIFSYRWTGPFGVALPDHTNPEGQTVVTVPGEVFETTTEIDTDQVPFAEPEGEGGTKQRTRKGPKAKAQKPEAVADDPIDPDPSTTDDPPADDPGSQPDPDGASATDSTASPEA